jgi:beta-carotene 15,15'-dioxygenase
VILSLKKYRYHILATLAFIILSYLLDVFFQGVIAFFMILSVGIVHGANDLQLIQKKTQKKSQIFFLSSLSLYIGVVLVGIFLFYLLPVFGLLFFVAFSAYHFGEQHLASKISAATPSWLRVSSYLSYGLALFGLLFTLQWGEVHQIIYIISQAFVSKQSTEALFFIGLALFLLSAALIPSLRYLVLFELVLLAFIGLLFSRASLLLGFGVYFVVWHSIPSIQDQVEFLYNNKAGSGWSYFKSSAPYWLLSLVGLFGVYFLFDVHSWEFLPLFFSFLAAITFPHTVVMGWLKLSEDHASSRQSIEAK